MGAQAELWKSSEADAWHKRNKYKLRATASDPVMSALLRAGIYPKSVFEVGCANGYRLAYMRDMWNIEVNGCDLSTAAIQDGLETYGLELLWREASRLKGVRNKSYDMVIYGFCLYQCDPEDLFSIVLEGDRILKDDGYLVVYDFLPDHPHVKKYAHEPSLKTFKHDYASLWLANPAYKMAHQSIFAHEADESIIDHNNRVAVTILKKEVVNAFPVEA